MVFILVPNILLQLFLLHRSIAILITFIHKPHSTLWEVCISTNIAISGTNLFCRSDYFQNSLSEEVKHVTEVLWKIHGSLVRERKVPGANSHRSNLGTPNGAFTLHGTGTGTGTGNGTGKNGFLYIMQECSHCTEGEQGLGMGTENLSMGTHFSSSGAPCPCPGPGSVQCERAIMLTRRFLDLNRFFY